MCIELYQTECDGYLPPDLEVIEKMQYVENLKLTCPSARTHRESDYFYFSGFADPETGEQVFWGSQPALLRVTFGKADKTIFCCDYKSNHSGRGRHVIYGNGNIIWLTETEFQDEIKKLQYRPFRNALDIIDGN